MSQDDTENFARKGQTAAIIIAVAMLIWFAFQWIGPWLGLPGRYAILIDLAAMAALIYALIMTYQMWRSRQDKG